MAKFNRKIKKAYDHGFYKLAIKYGWKIPKSARDYGASKVYGKASSVYHADPYSGAVEILQIETAHEVSNWKKIFNGDLVHHRITETDKHTDFVHNFDIVKIWAKHLKKAVEKYN
jgi:hypothetical protein